MSPHFTEINSGGLLHREDLISIILGADPGVWHTEDFTARELAPTVVLVTYRHLIDDDGVAPIVALRSSIWHCEDGARQDRFCPYDPVHPWSDRSILHRPLG